MTYADDVSADRRLVILRLLSEDPGYSHNDRVLQTALARIGHAVSRDAVRSDMAWLAEQGLATVEVIENEVHVAKLTERGADVAAGRATVPGVKRPSPGR